MSLQDKISDFLRDGQYRSAEITSKLNREIIDVDSREYKRLHRQRLLIDALISVLHYPYQDIKTGEFGLDVLTEFEIELEIEYVRKECEMNDIPWISFSTYRPEIRVFTSGSGGVSEEIDPTNLGGDEGQLAQFNSQNKLIGVNKPVKIGWTNPDIASYFADNAAFSEILIPTYSASEWSAEDPYLEVGQIGIELNESDQASRCKVGPGLWNSLPYFNQTVIESGGLTVTNPIGDASGDLSGQSLIQVLSKMLAPYTAPVITNLRNNAGGTYGSTNTLNIGETVAGTVSLQYNISNEENLSGANPINVTAGGVFSNEGNFANGQIDLTLASPLTPTALTNIEIKVKVAHTNGVTQEFKTYIRFYPQIIWGVSQKDSLTASEIASISSKQTLVTNEYKRTYQFNQSGFRYIFIPTTLSPSNLVFADLTDEIVVNPIDIDDLGVVTNVNNGLGIYDYQVLRTTYNITENFNKIRVA